LAGARGLLLALSILSWLLILTGGVSAVRFQCLIYDVGDLSAVGRG